MELRVAVIVDEDAEQMKRLEDTILLFGIPVVCFKFTNLFDAVEFIFLQPEPVDYVLLEVDTVYPQEECLLKTLPWLRIESEVVVAAYSQTRVKDVVAIKQHLSADLVVTLPVDGCDFKFVASVGYILVFNEMKDPKLTN